MMENEKDQNGGYSSSSTSSSTTNTTNTAAAISASAAIATNPSIANEQGQVDELLDYRVLGEVVDSNGFDVDEDSNSEISSDDEDGILVDDPVIAPANTSVNASSGNTRNQHPKKKGMTLSFLYVSLLMLKSRVFRRGAYLVVLFWLILLALGACYGLRFINETTARFDAVAGSPSEAAERAFANDFPYEAARAAATMVVISPTKHAHFATDKSIVDFDNVKLFDAELKDLCQKTYGSNVVYVSYYTLTKGGLSPLAKEALDDPENPRAMLISITRTDRGMLVTSDSVFVTWLEESVEILSGKHLKDEKGDQQLFRARVTGVLAFYRDVNEGTERDLRAIDLISFPLALVILAGMLKSIRLLFLPILNIVISILVSFLIMWPIAKHSEVITYAPSIMGSTALALSIDFSMFLLARYRHELTALKIPRNANAHIRRQMQRDAVERMLATSGHTIFVSGVTLAACWFALCGFPVLFLSTIGVAAGVTSLISLLVNVTMTPAMLISFPYFFTNLDENFHGIAANLCCCRCCGMQKRPLHDGETSVHSTQTPLLGATSTVAVVQINNDPRNTVNSTASSGSQNDTQRLQQQTSLWYKFAHALLKNERRALIVTLIIIALCIPFAMYALKTGHSNSFLLSLPRDKQATKAYSYLNRHFGAGRMSPYHLLIRPSESESVLSEKFWDYVAKDVIENTLLDGNEKVLSRSGIQAPMFIDSDIVPFLGSDKFSAEYCAKMEEENKNDYPYKEQCDSLKVVASRQVARMRDPNTGEWVAKSIYVQVELAIEPESAEGSDFVRDLRKRLDALSLKDGKQYFLAGGDVMMLDIVDSVYDAFPRAISVTTLIVFIFIGVAFRSFIVPIRSVLTITLTICVIWGTSSLVYEHGILDSLGIAPFTTVNGGDISWIAPVVSFSVAVGLSLDYDCYLMTRILESGEHMSEQEAVIDGLASSGSIITAAGVIMVVAWSGLLLSSQPVLNQIGFYLVCAVLMDCLVVRTILVPCLMFLLGSRNLNWFPRGKWKRCFRRICCKSKSR